MTARPDLTPRPAQTEVEEPRRRRLWLLLIPLVIVAVPAAIVMGLNLGEPKVPRAEEGLQTVVYIQDMPALARLKLEGGRRLTELIASGKPSKNPWTIVTVYWRLHRPKSVHYEPQTGLSMPVFDADAWAILTVPIKDSPGKDHAYHYVQDGNLAYLQGPEGGQVLIMPFTAEDLHAQLAGLKKPLRLSTRPAAP